MNCSPFENSLDIFLLVRQGHFGHEKGVVRCNFSAFFDKKK